MSRLLPDKPDGWLRTIHVDDPRIARVEVIVGVNGIDTADDNADVDVVLEGGHVLKYVFLTPQNAATLLARWRLSGECGGGAFLSMTNSVVVPNLTEEALRAAVVAMADEGEFEATGHVPESDEAAGKAV